MKTPAADLFRPLVRQMITPVPISLPVEALAMANPERRRAARAERGLADEPVLMCVSRLVDGKGQERLIALMPQILARHPEAVLVLVGDGELRADLEALAESLGVTARVRFLGNRFDIPELLRLADVFVFGDNLANNGDADSVVRLVGRALSDIDFGNIVGTNFG